MCPEQRLTQIEMVFLDHPVYLATVYDLAKE